jgi:hypothetical protein
MESEVFGSISPLDKAVLLCVFELAHIDQF